VVAAKGGVSLLPHQQDLQPILSGGSALERADGLLKSQSSVRRMKASPATGH